jgi:hypothetical protein
MSASEDLQSDTSNVAMCGASAPDVTDSSTTPQPITPLASTPSAETTPTTTAPTSATSPAEGRDVDRWRWAWIIVGVMVLVAGVQEFVVGAVAGGWGVHDIYLNQGRSTGIFPAAG